MSKQTHTSGVARSGGFTIAELLVSLVIMVIVASQLTMILLTQNRVYAEQDRVLDAQEDARLVAEIISADLRTAGFLVPAIVGISSRDGGTQFPDTICMSDPTTIAETSVSSAKNSYDRGILENSLSGDKEEIVLDSLDIDKDTSNDFVVGAGVIISDGTDSHCARIKAVDVGGKKLQFVPKTPASSFSIASGAGRATPALVYQVTSNGLTRNGALLSPRVENLQIQYAIDTDGNGLIEGAEFPIDDLDGNSAADILRVQVTVVTRSSRPDPEFRGFGMPATANHTGTAADGFRRRVVTVNVDPRNM